MIGDNREKAQAIVLSGVMLLSVVAMSTAFTGGAAAQPVRDGGTEIHTWTDLNQTRDNPDTLL